MSDLAIFPLTSEHKMLRDAARDFAQKEIAPIAAEFDESGEFPAKTIRKMGEMGFMGIEVPEEYGGSEMDSLAYVLALEEICKVDASHGVIMSVNNSLYCHGIMKFGSNEQREKTTWFRVSAWNRLAENCNHYVHKGMRVLVTGDVEASAWSGEDGTARATLELVARDVKFLSRNEEGGGRQNENPASPEHLEDIPF